MDRDNILAHLVSWLVVMANSDAKFHLRYAIKMFCCLRQQTSCQTFHCLPIFNHNFVLVLFAEITKFVVSHNDSLCVNGQIKHTRHNYTMQRHAACSKKESCACRCNIQIKGSPFLCHTCSVEAASYP